MEAWNATWPGKARDAGRQPLPIPLPLTPLGVFSLEAIALFCLPEAPRRREPQVEARRGKPR
jgi:hypothetical protein